MDCAGLDTVGLGPLIEGKSAFPPAPVTIRQSTIVPKTKTETLTCLQTFKASRAKACRRGRGGEKAAH